MLDAQQWHARYQQQANWTQDLRSYLFPRAGLPNARRVLEVGCGTGVLLAEIQQSAPFCHGIDLDLNALQFAQQRTGSVKLTQGDGLALPYRNASFDLVFCHFLLLWIGQPGQLLREMCRVTRPGGTILALAEPDYGGRIDYPDELEKLGQMQFQALLAQGADPVIGRKLRALFHQAGLQAVESGVLGGQWNKAPDWPSWQLEWQVLVSDLEQLATVSPDQLQELENFERLAWQQGQRILFVPTFYAWGQVPGK